MSKTGAGQGRAEAPPSNEQAGQGPEGSGWRETGEELGSLKESFRSSYQDGAAEGPSTGEVTQAFRTLGGAVSKAVSGAGNTLKDPAVKRQFKKTSRTAFSALAAVLSGWKTFLLTRLGSLRRPKTNHDAGSGAPDSATPAMADHGSLPATGATGSSTE